MKYLLILLLITGMGSEAIAAEKIVRILFDFNRADIPDSSLVSLMKWIPHHEILAVRIEGHCDSVGSGSYNRQLSETRARALRKLLVENGVSAGMITSCIGYGKEKPETDNHDEAARQQNRRVLICFQYKEAEIRPARQENRVITKQTSILPAGEMHKGQTLILKKLLFYGGRHLLKPESEEEAEALCSWLQQHPRLSIEIQGHVCCTSTEPDGFDVDTRTQDLSVRRAKAIYDYLIQRCGIEASRLSYRGYGGRYKLTLHEETEDLQQINRRVEIRITGE